MKNVTITNGQIASRAIATTLVLALGYFMVKQAELDNAALPTAVATASPPPATIFVPHHMRGIYYTGDDCDKTAAHEVYIGMPEAQIQCQTGEPETVNRSQSQYGSSAQYVFDGTTDRWYLYVTNGMVSSWHQSWTK